LNIVQQHSYVRFADENAARCLEACDNGAIYLSTVRSNAVLGGWRLPLSATFPVSRLSAAMYNCQNKNVVLLNRIENAIRKLVCQASSNLFINYAPASRSFSNSVDCILNSINKRLRYLSTTLCIVLNYLSIFSKCFRVKYIPHCSRSCLT
jgi:hypothetical protein